MSSGKFNLSLSVTTANRLLKIIDTVLEDHDEKYALLSDKELKTTYKLYNTIKKEKCLHEKTKRQTLKRQRIDPEQREFLKNQDNIDQGGMI